MSKPEGLFNVHNRDVSRPQRDCSHFLGLGIYFFSRSEIMSAV